MVEIIQIPIAHPKSHLDELRGAFGVPKEYTDEALLQALIGIVIDDYMNVEKIEAEVLPDALTNGIISKRWLDKDLEKLGKEKKLLEKTIDETIGDLIQAFDDNLQTKDDIELAETYEHYFGEKIKIVE